MSRISPYFNLSFGGGLGFLNTFVGSAFRAAAAQSGPVKGPQTLMDVKNLNTVPSFITKDGSEIRELLAYRNSVIRRQSLAEARLPAGGSTQEHYHPNTEEIYYVTNGRGRMRIEDEIREVGPGDTIAIPPGKKHKIWNIGEESLRILCCCVPAYEDEDTVITEGQS